MESKPQYVTALVVTTSVIELATSELGAVMTLLGKEEKYEAQQALYADFSYYDSMVKVLDCMQDLQNANVKLHHFMLALDPPSFSTTHLDQLGEMISNVNLAMILLHVTMDTAKMRYVQVLGHEPVKA